MGLGESQVRVHAHGRRAPLRAACGRNPLQMGVHESLARVICAGGFAKTEFVSSKSAELFRRNRAKVMRICQNRWRIRQNK